MKKNETSEEYELVEDEEYGSSPHVKSRTKRLREELKKCKQEKQEYLEGWQRAKADLINARKDADARIAAVHERAGEHMIMELLPVLDNLHLALASVSEENDWTRGCAQVLKQFEQVLKSAGAEEMVVRVGDTFDPARHEAVMHKGGERKDTILEVRKRGYMLGDRVLRPAQVVVADGEAEEMP